MPVQNLKNRAIFGLPICILWFALAEWQSVAATHEHEHPVPEKLGIVKFPTSCPADVQQEFERGVALLHSFAYSSAEKAFRNLIVKDPNCAMAHWGVAVEKRPVTPGAIVPAREQLGDLLLESNRAPEAVVEFERTLKMAPQRRTALIGQARAREMLAAGKRE
jgi:predicted Zn-dependent protease